MSGALRSAISAVVAGAATYSVRQYLETSAPRHSTQWDRTNHRGETISLLEGPAVTAGLACAALVSGSGSASARLAQGIATIGAGSFGLYDDLAEDTTVRSKGLKGHLRSLAQGTLTTGGLKIIGIGATAALAAGLSAKARKSTSVADLLLDTVIIAGSANLINLLDLRPGRAFKALALPATALAGAGSGAGGAILGTAVAALPRDLGEQDMLGDCGANALGALAGTAFVQTAPRTTRCVGAVAIVGLTLLSEKVSFSRIIADTPVLNTIDMFGRRPAHNPATAPSESEAGTGESSESSSEQ